MDIVLFISTLVSIHLILINTVAIEVDAEAYDSPTIDIVDLTGKNVAQYEFADKNKVKIATADFKAGIYFVKLNDNGRFIETQKLIIQ